MRRSIEKLVVGRGELNKSELTSQDLLLRILSSAYVISCLLFLTCVFLWVGGLLIWMSIYLFGLPLLFMITPFFGLGMFRLRGRVQILIYFLMSLTPLLYLLPALSTFPFTVQTDAAGHTAPISVCLTIAIIVSASFFLLTSVSSFLYCQKVYRRNLS